MSGRNIEKLVCSFCHKPQSDVSKLITRPSDYPRAYICDECVAVCNSILVDEGIVAEPPNVRAHPLAAPLLQAIEAWIKEETSGEDASAELARVRELARLMFAE